MFELLSTIIASARLMVFSLSSIWYTAHRAFCCYLPALHSLRNFHPKQMDLFRKLQNIFCFFWCTISTISSDLMAFSQSLSTRYSFPYWWAWWRQWVGNTLPTRGLTSFEFESLCCPQPFFNYVVLSSNFASCCTKW